MEDLKGKSYEELNELVQINAEGLSKANNVKVFPLLLNTAGFDKQDGEWIIAYYKAVTLYQKMTLLDNLDSGNKTLKASQIVKANLLKENSMMSYFDEKNPKNDNIIIGAALDCINNAINFSINQAVDLKKNTQ